MGKGTRLSLNKQPVVSARKGAKRVHNNAPEHGQNLTNVAVQAIPPVILFKSERLKHEWLDILLRGSDIFMTSKGSIPFGTFMK